jgi:hypothetical protein
VASSLDGDVPMHPSTRRALSYRFQLEEGVTFGLFGRRGMHRLAATYVRVHEVVAGLLASGEAVFVSARLKLNQGLTRVTRWL